MNNYLLNPNYSLTPYANMGSYGLSPGVNLNGPSASPVLGGTSPDFNSWMPDWLKGAVGTKEAPGWGSLALGSAQALGGLFMGMKQYGIAKKTFNENKRQFQLNWDANRNLINAQLADRQAGRIAASGPDGRHASVADYMAQYGIK